MQLASGAQQSVCYDCSVRSAQCALHNNTQFAHCTLHEAVLTAHSPYTAHTVHTMHNAQGALHTAMSTHQRLGEAPRVRCTTLAAGLILGPLPSGDSAR